MRAKLTSLIIALGLVACSRGDDRGAGTSGPPGSPGQGSNHAPAAGGDPNDVGRATGKDAQSPSKQDWADEFGTASLGGTVKFEGQAPVRKVINQSSDSGCHAEGLLEEHVIVSANGGLMNVFVSIDSGLESYIFPKGTGSVALDQEGCQYKPHALGMIKGQTLIATNSDSVTHNLHPYAVRQSLGSPSHPAGPLEISFVMKRAERPFAIKCDMHSWMACYVGVYNNQFFAVSDADGAFTLPMLPAGTYKVSAWHESLGSSSQTVTLAEDDSQKITFSFKAK